MQTWRERPSTHSGACLQRSHAILDVMHVAVVVLHHEVERVAFAVPPLARSTRVAAAAVGG